MPPSRIPFTLPLQNALSRPQSATVSPSHSLSFAHTHPLHPSHRNFTSTASPLNWLVPNRKITFKDPKGRPRMPTGGSVRGTTLVWGDYGLRMLDHDRRVSAAQLKNGEDVIRRRLRGNNFRLFMRIHAGTAVFTKGNESRMGTGKGSFDYWAARVPVSRIIFEIKADVHEQVIRDAMRLAANKMPGMYEFVKKGDSPVMGITKLTNGITAEDLRRPRRTTPLPLASLAKSTPPKTTVSPPSTDHTAHRLPGPP